MAILFESYFNEAADTDLNAISPAGFWTKQGSYGLFTNGSGLLVPPHYPGYYTHDVGSPNMAIEGVFVYAGGTTPPIWLRISGDGGVSQSGNLNVISNGGNWTLVSSYSTIATITDSWATTGAVRRVWAAYNNGTAYIAVWDGDGNLIGSQKGTVTRTGTVASVYPNGNSSTPEFCDLDYLRLEDFTGTIGFLGSTIFESEFNETSGTDLDDVSPADFWVRQGSYYMETDGAGYLGPHSYSTIYAHQFTSTKQAIEIVLECGGDTTAPYFWLGVAGSGGTGMTSYINAYPADYKCGNWCITRNYSTLATITDSWLTAGTKRRVRLSYQDGIASLEVWDGSGTLIGAVSAPAAPYGNYGAVGAAAGVGVSTPRLHKADYLKALGEATSGSATTYTYSGTGAMTSGGSTSKSRTIAKVGTGAITSGGSSTESRTFAKTGVGAVNSGGSASVCRSFGVAAQGNIVLGGSASESKSTAVAGQALIVVSGSADVSFGNLLGSWEYAGVGALGLGGFGSLIIVRTYSGDVGLILGGQANVVHGDFIRPRSSRLVVLSSEHRVVQVDMASGTDTVLLASEDRVVSVATE